MKKYYVLFVIAVLAITLMVACTTKTETQIVEVTRLVPEQVTQIVTIEVERSGDVSQPVEVTRLVEVTRIVEVENEVTREVLVEPSVAPEPETGKLSTHGISDVVQIYRFNMTLNSVQVINGILSANFTIENISDENGIASKFDFVAKNSEDIKLEDEYYECGPEISSQLAPGDRTKGDICWKGATGNTFKIQYTTMDDDYNSVIAVWSVTIE